MSDTSQAALPLPNSKRLVVHNTPLHYVEHGSGIPVIALHGSYSAHQEIAASLEPFFQHNPGYRRIYVDLPGMGYTPADGVNSADDVLERIVGFVSALLGDEPCLLIGHSYGGYLARAIAKRLPKQVFGLALLCPLMGIGENGGQQVPSPVVIHAEDGLSDFTDEKQESEYRNYFVVHTAATRQRFQEALVPAMALVDSPALERMGAKWQLTTAPESGAKYTSPTVILLGRQDSTVGYADQWGLIEHYPRATFAVLDRAGHALPHEQPDLLNALLSEWLRRVKEAQAESK